MTATMSSMIMPTMLSDRVALPWQYVSGVERVRQNLTTWLQHQYEGRCILQGYVVPRSLKLQTCTMGTMARSGTEMLLDVNFSVDVALPAAGDVLENCVVNAVSAAGLLCTFHQRDLAYDFLQVFVSREAMLKSENKGLRTKFIELIDAKDPVVVRVKVQRCNFHLGDRYITVLGVIENEEDIMKGHQALLPAVANVYDPYAQSQERQGQGQTQQRERQTQQRQQRRQGPTQKPQGPTQKPQGPTQPLARF